MPPVAVTENYDAVLTTTARLLRRSIGDNISRGHRLIAWLEMHGRTRGESGGERIQEPLMYQLNTGADIYQGYGPLSTAPQDGITSAFFPWAQMAVPVTISGKERRQNNGVSRLISLLDAKTTQAEESAKELQNNCLVAGRLATGATGNLNQFVARIGQIDTSAQGPLPLPALVDANPARSVAIGEINGATATWWRNYALAATATTFRGYLMEKRRLYNNCSRGSMGNPDLIVSDQYCYELYWSSLTNQERYYVTDQRAIDILGGSDMLKFLGAIHIWDEVVNDVGTSTASVVDAIGTLTNGAVQTGAHSTEYHLNSQAMSYVYHTDANWEPTPFDRIPGADASVSHRIWQGQLCVNNRRKLGVMYDIKNDIAA